MNKVIYALGKGRKENIEMLELLRSRGYQWNVKDSDNLDRNMVLMINTQIKDAYPLDFSKMAPYDIEAYFKKAISLEELKDLLSISKQQETDVQKDDTKSILKFVRITSKQIVARWASPNAKDDYGNPIMLVKVRMPSENLARSPLMQDGNLLKNPYLLVHDYMIKDDKFWKKDDNREHKVIGLKPEKEYLVMHDAGNRNQNGYRVDDVLKVKGKDLIEAFQYKKKEKSLDERLRSAQDKTKEKDTYDKTMDKEKAKQDLSK